MRTMARMGGGRGYNALSSRNLALRVPPVVYTISASLAGTFLYAVCVSGQAVD